MIALLHPLALLLLPTVALPYLLSRPRTTPARRLVSAIDLWRDPARSSPDRLSTARRLSALTVTQSLLIAAIVFALAAPVVSMDSSRAIFVIDTSATMGARNGDGSRLDAARTRARAVADSLPSSTDIRLIDAGASSLNTGWVRRGSARFDSQLSALRPGLGPSAIERAVSVARGEADGVPVFVFTDQPPDQAAQEIRWEQVGSAAVNAGITGLFAAKTPSGIRVTFEVSSFGDAAHALTVAIDGDGRPISSRQVDVDANASRTFVELIPAGAATIRARLTDHRDALAADDVRLATVAEPPRRRVRIDGEPDPFIERVLDTNPSARRSTGEADALICIRCPAAPADDTPALVIPPPAGLPMAAAPLQLQERHAVTRGLALEESTAAIARPVATDGDVVITAGGRPFLTVSARNGRRTAILNLDLRSNAFVLDPMFPVLVANTIDWLTERPQVPDTRNVDPSASDLRSVATGSSHAERAVAVGHGELELTRGLLAFAMALLVLETWLRHRRRRSLRWPVRVALAVLLVLAAIGLQLPFGSAGVEVVFALDQSGSIRLPLQRQAARGINAWIAGASSRDTAGLVVFGSTPELARRPGRQAIDASAVIAPPGGTDIERAIDLAGQVAGKGPGSRIALISDGHETSGSARAAAARAAANGVPVDVMVLHPQADAATARSVTAPPQVRVDEPFSVAVTVSGKPASEVEVSLLTDDGRSLSRAITLGADGTGAASFPERRAAPGVFTYRAMVGDDPGDMAPGAVVIGAGHPALLVVTNTRSGSLGSLPGAGYSITTTSPAAMPATARELAAYDGVILDDVQASSVPAPALTALHTYVTADGGGLLLLGGGGTLGRAGYPQTALDPVLPVDFRERAGSRGSSVAYMVVFDKSGSMADAAAGVPKIELARQAVIQALTVLRDASVGVVAFDGTPTLVVPLANHVDAAAAASRLRTVIPGGATAVAPALDVAARALRQAPQKRRRVLLISDGRTSPADAERLRTVAAAREFELSVVAIGTDADRALLTDVAQRSGGRAYFPSDLRQLPDIAAADAAEASRGGIVEGRVALHASEGHPVLSQIESARLPGIGGYVAGTLRPGATAILASASDDPVLAAWRAGLGRVAVYSGGLQSSWSAALRTWPQSPQLWAQTVRWISRSAGAGSIDADVVETGTGLQIEVDAPQAAALRAHVRAPDGGSRDVALIQRDPGRYVGVLGATRPGPYVVAIDIDGEGGENTHVLRGLYWSGAAERVQTHANSSLLDEIAAATGGRRLESGDTPFNAPHPWAWHELSRPLTAAALILFFLELVLRRTPFRRGHLARAA